WRRIEAGFAITDGDLEDITGVAGNTLDEQAKDPPAAHRFALTRIDDRNIAPLSDRVRLGSEGFLSNEQARTRILGPVRFRIGRGSSGSTIAAKQRETRLAVGGEVHQLVIVAAHSGIEHADPQMPFHIPGNAEIECL